MNNNFTERYLREDNRQTMSMDMKKKIGIFALALFLTVGLVTTGCGNNSDDITASSSDIESEMDVQIPSEGDNSSSGMATIKDESSKPSQSGQNMADIKENMVDISIAGSGRADPFLPFPEAGGYNQNTEKLPYLVLPPLETAEKDDSAEKILTTKISGIMYDDTSPSAILNIEGTDYLVRSGDVINNYKVLSISKSVVVVQLGSNVYRAGVGQILTSGEVKHNEIANLDKKFGGARK